ncbi:MAG: endonuclease domain-containing protein [Alphaproteobacteria bacterium]
MRRQQTDSERLLWAAFRRAQIEGVQFRRQQAIGPFVVDFFCPAARLVVEVDGEQHGNDGVHARDVARTRWLEARGYRVLRFWNEDVKNNREGVAETIRLAVRARMTPPPQPSPTRGEGEKTEPQTREVKPRA